MATINDFSEQRGFLIRERNLDSIGALFLDVPSVGFNPAKCRMRFGQLFRDGLFFLPVQARSFSLLAFSCIRRCQCSNLLKENLCLLLFGSRDLIWSISYFLFSIYCLFLLSMTLLSGGLFWLLFSCSHHFDGIANAIDGQLARKILGNDGGTLFFRLDAP